MSYNLRSTSYIGNKLDNELLKRGAATFGEQDRKQARLQRFMNHNENMQITVKNNQRSVVIEAADGLMRLRSHRHTFFDQNGNITHTR